MARTGGTPRDGSTPLAAAGSGCARTTRAGGAVTNTLVAVDPAEQGPGRVLARGARLLCTPATVARRRRLGLADLEPPEHAVGRHRAVGRGLAADGRLAEPRRVAGGPGESIFQPEWSPDGALDFVSDRTGWWNLYRLRPERRRVRPLCPREAEFGRAAVGLRNIDIRLPSAGPARLRLSPRTAASRLGHARSEQRRSEPARSARTREFGYIRAPAAASSASPARRPSPPAVVSLDLATAACEVLRQAATRRRRPGAAALFLDSAADRVPHRGRPHRLRHLLPAAQPRLRGAARARGRRWWS